MKGTVTGSLLQFSAVVSRRLRSDREFILPDGLKLRLRELRPDDRARLQRFLARCSAESIRTRFFRPINEFPDALLDQLLTVEGQRRLALIVTRGEGDNEEIVAEGRAVVSQKRPQIADVAFLVQDELQRRGIATRLLRELTTLACRRGLTHFSADVLADNRAMLALIRKTGRRLASTISYGVIHFEIPLTCGDAAALPRVA
jgi:RimJ/RimL family protein N-acetyltransferase